MNKTCTIIASVYSFLLTIAVFAVSLAVIHDTVQHAALLAVYVAAFLALTFVGLKRKTMISFALSVIPAVLVWRFLYIGQLGALLGAIIYSLGLGVICRLRIPEARKTTDGWVGMLILICITCLLPFIVMIA